MCGRFYRHGVSWDEYHDALGVNVPSRVEPPEPAYNIAPSQITPIIRIAPEGEDVPLGAVQMAPAMWGLVPSWWHKPLSEKNFSTFNARSETVQESNTFRGAFRHRRCLVPASGFYEWTGPKGHKTPYAIGLRNRRWFCFAGLWDRAMIDGSEIDSFTILTIGANALMSALHTRMPVILDPAGHSQWLEGTPKEAAALFEPYPPGAMHAWRVGKAVGNVRNQGVQLIEDIEA